MTVVVRPDADILVEHLKSEWLNIVRWILLKKG